MNKVADCNFLRSLSFRLRRKRAKRIVDLVEDVYADRRKVEIVDVGGTREYWNIIPMEYLLRRNVHITLVNISTAENAAIGNDGVFSCALGDGCGLEDIGDCQFDIAHSNSVIEHVGDWDRMAHFAKEMRRIARSYYVQTPNYFFPVEPHFLFPFFHWLPLAARIRLAMRFSLGCFPRASSMEEAMSYIELCRLLTKSELQHLFPDAALYRESLLFLAKSFVLIRKGLD